MIHYGGRFLMKTDAVIAVIGGTDPSGGAGLSADQETARALNIKAHAFVTAVIAQDDQEVRALEPVSENLMAAQLTILQKISNVQAIKIGLIADRKAAELLAVFLDGYKGWVVLDPVGRASNGGALTVHDRSPLPLAGEGLGVRAKQEREKLERLFPHTSLLTPNREEAEVLTGIAISDEKSVRAAAEALLAAGAKAVLLKGGHLHAASPWVQDFFTDGTQAFWLTTTRQPGTRRGTGCRLATAIACFLAQGFDIPNALVLARSMLNAYLRTGQMVWPAAAEDFPWMTDTALAGQTPPPATAAITEHLGFYPIVDNLEVLARLLVSGVRTLQFRLKNPDEPHLENLIRDAIALGQRYGARLFINDYWQLAIRHGAYGVHVGQSDLKTLDRHALSVAGLRLGVSTHSPVEMAHAHAVRPSYIAMGPVFETQAKFVPFPPCGVEWLRTVKALSPYPVVAIGGISLSRAGAVAATGVDGIAVISAVRDAGSPEKAAADWLSLERYQRHLALPEVGLVGQARLKASRVLVIGAGGLGAPLLTYLAAAGVGQLGIVDHDVVERSNLQRQVLFTQEDEGLSKALVAKKRLEALNPDCHVQAYAFALSAENSDDLFAHYDVIADASDNFQTRLLINQTAVRRHQPYVYAGIHQFEGQCSVFGVPGGPCYRCLYPNIERSDQPNCSEAGVLGVLPGIVGSVQAAQVLWLLLDQGQPLVGRLWCLDTRTMQSKSLNFSRDPDCAVCESQSHVLAKKEVPVEAPVREISVQDLRAWQAAGENFCLLDVREAHERAVFHIGGEWIRLAELPEQLAKLDPAQKIVVYCRSGGRSHQAVRFLQSRGFTEAFNLVGGVMAWQREGETSNR
jgi:hydroxymethylpyrimidine kinase/phosphomethylpyrimidine kinase/thiamine-phosphate diphosphorylase